MLLPDAEIPKNIPEHFISRNLADDRAEVVDGFADILCGEVGRESAGKAFLGEEEGSAGIGEGLYVTLICNEGCVAVSEKISL